MADDREPEAADGGELAGAEAEMAATAAEAGTRLRAALAWLREADRELDGLQRPVWGGVVDSWHRAGAAAADSLEAVEAFEAFGGYPGR